MIVATMHASPPPQTAMRSWITFLVIVSAIALGTGLSAARRLPAPVYRWPALADHGFSTPFSAATVLTLDETPALLWQPSPSAAPWVLDSLAAGPSAPVLAYADVQPRAWQTAPREHALHLIWIDRSGLLRSALVDRAGQTLRGPVDLLPWSGRILTAVPASGGRALVLWTAGAAAQLTSLLLDAQGRPGPITSHPLRHVDLFAAQTDLSGQVHVAWITTPTPGIWSLHYTTTSPAGLDFTGAITLATLALPPQTALTSLSLGLDSTHSYVIIGTTHAAQPDIETVEVLSFPLHDPAQLTRTALSLPVRFTPHAAPPALKLTAGYLAALPSDPAPSAALRWARPAPGQHQALALAVSMRQAGRWLPAVVFFQDGAPMGFQIISDRPADASPPDIAITRAGDLVFTWAGFQGVMAHRYTASTAGAGWRPGAPEKAQLVLQTLAALLTGFPLALLWLILPALLLRLAPRRAWSLPLAAIIYGTARLVWPPGLYAVRPPFVAALGLPITAPGVGVIAGAIPLLSGVLLLAIAQGQPSPRLRWLIPVLLDISLTLGLFGTQVWH